MRLRRSENWKKRADNINLLRGKVGEVKDQAAKKTERK